MDSIEYKGYKVKLANPSGGKAGKGKNLTTTLQVFKDGCIKKSFRFKVDDPEGHKKAARKAREYIDGL